MRWKVFLGQVVVRDDRGSERTPPLIAEANGYAFRRLAVVVLLNESFAGRILRNIHALPDQTAERYTPTPAKLLG